MKKLQVDETDNEHVPSILDPSLRGPGPIANDTNKFENFLRVKEEAEYRNMVSSSNFSELGNVELDNYF